MISDKIILQIKNLSITDNMKQLMLMILEEEDKGTYKYKEIYDKFVNEYLIKAKGTNSDDHN